MVEKKTTKKTQTKKAEPKKTQQTQQESEPKKTRTRSANRPYDVVIADIQEKIEKLEARLAELKNKKKDLEAKDKERKAKAVLDSALESGLTPEQIMERLNIKP